MTSIVLTNDELLERIRRAPMSLVGLKTNQAELLSRAKALSDGHYICTTDLVPDVLDGPYLDRAFAVHRARNLYGMTEPDTDDNTAPPVIDQDELPW